MKQTYKDHIQDLMSAVVGSFGYPTTDVEVTRPAISKFGEYTTNVALTIAHQNHENPIDIAKKIKDILGRVIASSSNSDGDLTTYQIDQTKHDFKIKPEWKNVLQAIEKIEIAGPGFINIHFFKAKISTLIDGLLFCENSAKIRQKQPGSKVMVEFAHPNTHKAFHIGHLRNIITGECIVRLLEAVGNTVIRANYQGDVGLHIGKAIWGITHIEHGIERINELSNKSSKEQVAFLGEAYAFGATKFEESDEVKQEVARINKQIYAKDPEIYPLYTTTRSWSLSYFDTIYKRVGSHFDRLYFESEVFEEGKRLVEDGVKKGIFVKDQGAIIFPGETFGLHNRVFITHEGNPTYEGKDMGLGKLQFDEFHPDKVIHCVGSEQTGYFQVIIEALSQLIPETTGKEEHLVYGWVNLKEGKMSSRTGQVVLGEWLIDTVKDEIRKKVLENISKDKELSQSDSEDISEKLAIAAVKYSFLKVGTKQEIAFDINESINLQGDSGPYLMYTYTRCQSVLRKASNKDIKVSKKDALSSEEKELVRLLLYAPEIIVEAADLYAPNILCTYLFALAQAFNLFYAKCPIIDDPYRLYLTKVVANVLQQGLYLLGISTVERM